MNKKILVGIAIGVIIVIGVSLLTAEPLYEKEQTSKLDILLKESQLTRKNVINSFNTIKLITNDNSFLFDWYVNRDQIVKNDDGTQTVSFMSILAKTAMKDKYEKLGFFNETSNVVVINPTFTAAAYSKPGFYQYYTNECDKKCLTVTVPPNGISGFTSSFMALQTFTFLQYNIVDDAQVAMNPSILQNYEKVIVLHNEYVTKKMFDAITTHPNVIHLYPNSLYGEVDYNLTDNTITLVRGHDYPRGEDIGNGFDWKNENTHPFEYDTTCLDMEFYPIDNGFMLNCYPENIFHNPEFLQMIKDI